MVKSSSLPQSSHWLVEGRARGRLVMRMMAACEWRTASLSQPLFPPTGGPALEKEEILVESEEKRIALCQLANLHVKVGTEVGHLPHIQG